MNTTTLVAAFIAVVSGLIWIGTQSNDADWAGNRNQCVGECYEDWKAENGGTIATVEQTKQAALAAASPEALERALAVGSPSNLLPDLVRDMLPRV